MKVLIPTVSESKEKHELPQDFHHQAPEGYEYRVVRKNASLLSIFTVYKRGFTYNSNSESVCIWGFYNTKKRCYYAPINSTKQGHQVDIKDTTPYTAMQLNLNPLMQCLMSPN